MARPVSAWQNRSVIDKNKREWGCGPEGLAKEGRKMSLAQVLRRQPSRPFLAFVLVLGTTLLLALLWSLDVQYQGHLLGWN
jgi:hypothetical protein